MATVAPQGNAAPQTWAELALAVGAIDRFPHSVVLEQLFAEEIVATAANENKLDEIAGASLAVDAAVAERIVETDPAGLTTLLDRLATALKFHFERVKSLAELFQLYNTAMFIVASLAAPSCA